MAITLRLKELLPNWIIERFPLVRKKLKRRFDPLGRLRDRFFPRHASMFYELEKEARDEDAAHKRRSRRLTAEELAELQHQQVAARQRRREASDLSRQAKNYKRIISDTLMRRGICHVRTDKGRQIVSRIKFCNPPNLNLHFIEWKVDTIHWPYGVNMDMLTDPGILDHVSTNCGHRVRYKHTHDCGFWFVVELDLGATGIPPHVDFEACYAMIPASRASDNMLVCLGQSENARPIWVTFPKFVNLKVSGSPESGKSNFMNSMLCWLIRRNKPWQLQFILIDMKEGMEFAEWYKGLPHLLKIPRINLKRIVKRKREKLEGEDGTDDLETIVKQEHLVAQVVGEPVEAIIEDREDLPGVLYWAVSESERRMKLVRGAKCKNIGEYNQMAHASPTMRPLSRIIIVIDELADVLMDEDIKDYAQRFLQNLTNRSRAVGIHVVACSQHTGRDLLPGRIQQAFRAMATFALSDRYVSVSTVGNASASRLDHVGRMIWSQGRYEIEIQAPYCPNSLVEKTVSDAILDGGLTRPPKPAHHDVDDMDIFGWALEHNMGHLEMRSVYDQFRSRGLSQKQVNKILKFWEGKEVIIDEQIYTVAPATLFPKRMPRRLLATNITKPDGDDN